METDGDAKNIEMPEHLDIADFKKFGKEDLRKLITKVIIKLFFLISFYALKTVFKFLFK